MSVPLEVPPLDQAVIDGWLRRLPRLVVNGARPASATDLAAHLGHWWLPAEVVLYVGKATRLGSRVDQYYATELGARGPHAGGAWLKTLNNLADLTVHWAATRRPADVESDLLDAFGAQAVVPARYPDQDPVLPWANLEIVRHGRRQRRRHSLRGARAEPRASA